MRHQHIVELQCGQRMRRHDINAFCDFQASAVGIHNEGADASGTWRLTCASKHHIKIGNAAIGNPSLQAIQTIAIGRIKRTALHGGHVRPRVGLA